MQNVYFWSGQITNDIAYISVLIGLLFLGLASFRIPQLYPRIFEAIIYYREELFFEEVRRYISPSFFRLLGRLQSSLLMTLTAYLYLEYDGRWLGASPEMIVLSLALFFIGFLSLFTIRRILYHTLGFVYLSPTLYRSWRAGYNLLEWLWTLPLYIAILLMTREETFWVGVWITAITFVLWRLFVIRRTVNTLKETEVSYMQLSLYLCTHETIPFVFLTWILVSG